MSTRIETILLRARDTLADPTGERWSEPRLLRLVEEGQQDIAKHTKILKAQIDIPLAVGQAVYTLPSDLWLITRAAFDDCIIPLHSHAQMDELIRNHQINNQDDYRQRRSYGYLGTSDIEGITSCWETDTGSAVEALIYDRRNIDEIRVYPIPGEGITQNDYTFETDNPAFEGAELLGVTTDITNYSFDTVFGVVTDLYDPQIQLENFISDFGVLTGVNDSKSALHIWYIRIPVGDITSVSSELSIPSMFDTALKHYVVSMAFDDDYDTRFAEKAQKAAALYERELGIVKETESHGATRDSQTNTTAYRGAFS
mgnify:FL=1|tara:strand:+ start:1898 stop:2836 length:939 start_codon:yes stop_codon:yes gene_type:complete